jgi:hypothetical protein
MMNRFGRAGLQAVLLSALLSLAACGHQPNGVLGNDLAGSDVASVIDNETAWNVVLHHPDLTVGKANCPHAIDIAYGATGECTLPVDGLPVPITVVTAPNTTRGFTVEQGAAIVEKSRAERYLTALVFAGTGMRSSAECSGGETSIMMRRDARMRCHVTLGGKTIEAWLGASPGYDDGVRLLSPDSLRRGFDAVDSYATAGIVPGAVARSTVTAIVQSMDEGELLRLGVIGAVTCPPELDLRNFQHVACSARIAGNPLAFTFSAPSSGGVRVATDQAIVLRDPIVAGLRSLYTRQFGMRAYDVNCGKVVVGIADPGSLFVCAVTNDGKVEDVPITITDTSGVPRLNGWRAVQGDGADQ